ncbi:helix-turn-helix domain-containing protein [Nanoarchaeota archaeon]
MQRELVEKVNNLLLKKGFLVKNIEKHCFDIMARKDKVLLLKLVNDANGVPKEFCDDLRQMGEMLGTAPLIISEKAGQELTDGVVYSRFGVYCLNFSTFKSCLEEDFPLVSRNRAGFTVRVNGQVLKQLREEMNFSLNSLASKVGVSREMMMKYENGSEVTLGRAEKFYDLFGENVFEKIEVFRLNNRLIKNFDNEYVQKYSDLGFGATFLKKAPFDIMARKEEEIVLTEIGDKMSKEFFKVANLIEGDNLVIFERKKPKDVPACTRDEFLEFEKAKELLKFVKEF